MHRCRAVVPLLTLTLAAPRPAPATPAQAAARTSTAPRQARIEPTVAARKPGDTTPRQYTGHPICLDFQGVDLRAVLRTFAEVTGLNLVIDPGVKGVGRRHAATTCRGTRRSR